jgi:hypothetical protein
LPVQEVENMLELSKTLKMSKMAKLVESWIDLKALAIWLKTADWEKVLGHLAPSLINTLRTEWQLTHYVTELNAVKKEVQLLAKLEWLTDEALKILKIIK